jgi:alpha-glucosidase
MTDVPIAPDQVQDPFEKNQPGKGLGRDPQRTPMQWSNAPHAGFTTGTPWLPLGADVGERSNVASQDHDDASILVFYRALLALRRQHACLNRGHWEPVGVEGDLLAYARIEEGIDCQTDADSAGDERALVLLNFGAAPVSVPAAWVTGPKQLWLSTVAGRTGAIGPGNQLTGDEGVVLGL